MTETYEAVAIYVAPHGWLIRWRSSESSTASCTTSGYGSDWRSYVDGTLGHHPGWDLVGPTGRTRRDEHNERHHIDDDVLVIDSRTITDEGARWTFAMSGPILGDVTPGMVRKIGAGEVPWDPAPVFGRPPKCWFLGNAYGLDEVAPDVLARIAERIGATITTVGAIRLEMWKAA